METMDLFTEKTGIGNPAAAVLPALPHTAPGSSPARNAGGYMARPPGKPASLHPSANLLLSIDYLYREKAAQDALPKIAPRFLNRSGLAWLPVMRLQREHWYFVVRFSNTLRANQLGKTSDWVIIRYRSDTHHSGQVTVVTDPHGNKCNEGSGKSAAGRSLNQSSGHRCIHGLASTGTAGRKAGASDTD